MSLTFKDLKVFFRLQDKNCTIFKCLNQFVEHVAIPNLPQSVLNALGCICQGLCRIISRFSNWADVCLSMMLAKLPVKVGTLYPIFTAAICLTEDRANCGDHGKRTKLSGVAEGDEAAEHRAGQGSDPACGCRGECLLSIQLSPEILLSMLLSTRCCSENSRAEQQAQSCGDSDNSKSLSEGIEAQDEETLAGEHPCITELSNLGHC